MKTKNLKVEKNMLGLACLTLILVTNSFENNLKDNCLIMYDHLHKYTDDNGFNIYKQSEEETIEGFHKTNSIIKKSEEAILIDELNLLKITDNISTLTNIMEKNKDFIQYEYKYKRYFEVRNNKYIIIDDYSFSNDINHENLTGRIRNVKYKYKAYKIVDNNGEKELVESPLVDNIIDIKDSYPYFKICTYKVKTYSDPYILGYQKTK